MNQSVGGSISPLGSRTSKPYRAQHCRDKKNKLPKWVPISDGKQGYFCFHPLALRPMYSYSWGHGMIQRSLIQSVHWVLEDNAASLQSIPPNLMLQLQQILPSFCQACNFQMVQHVTWLVNSLATSLLPHLLCYKIGPLVWWGVIWDSVPVDQIMDSGADRGPEAGKANPYTDCMSIPVKVNHCAFQNGRSPT